MLLALALSLMTSRASELYAQMQQDTRDRGRELDQVLRMMGVPLGRRIDECVLIAAPKDQDYEELLVSHNGTQTTLKFAFDEEGNIQFINHRLVVDLPDDPHEKDVPVKVLWPITDRALVPFSGGPTRMWNQHVFNPDQRHAIDLVSWRDGGSYGAEGTGEKDEEYAIWDAPVRAPVDGTIVSVENDADDHLKPQKEMTDDQHPFGNVVMIRIAASDPEGPELFVVLGHMRKGSVVVTAGMDVKAGDPIGHAGNSGNSSEPHLHMHVQDGPVIKQGNSVPFIVNGKPVRRGSLVEPPRTP